MTKEIQDFSEDKDELIEFTLDGDTFWAAGSAPGGALLDVVAAAESESQSDRLVALGDFVNSVLTDESAELFASRLRSADNPISIGQLSQVTKYLIGEYGSGANRATRRAAAKKRPTKGQ